MTTQITNPDTGSSGPPSLKPPDAGDGNLVTDRAWVAHTDGQPWAEPIESELIGRGLRMLTGINGRDYSALFDAMARVLSDSPKWDASVVLSYYLAEVEGASMRTAYDEVMQRWPGR